MKLRLFPVMALTSMMGLGMAEAQPAPPASDDWEFRVTPYLWGAGMDGTVGIAGREADFDVKTKDLLKSLDFGIMGSFEARRNRWSVGADAVYTDLGKDVTLETPIELPGEETPRLDMSMTILEGTVGYQVAKSLDVLAGLRGVAASSSLQVDEARTFAEADGGFADPIVGARFRRDLSEKLSVHLRGDVGGFGVGSDFSWFVNAAGAYRASRLISLDFGYRIWDFDYESDNDLKRLDAALGGFAFGLTFHF